jgi:hypothetical protein
MSEMGGVTYFRYSDDIRIAGPDRGIVKAAQYRLQSMMGDMGLRLNPAKTYFSGDDAHANAWKIEAVYDPLLQARGIAQGLKEDVAVSVDVLEEVYRRHLSPQREDSALPHQTLFNYTVNRLSKKGSPIVHDDLPALVQEHPGKMLDLIRYAVQTGYRDYAGLHQSLADKRLRDYFSYALLHRCLGLHAEGRAVPQEVSAMAEVWAADRKAPAFILSKAAEYLRTVPRYVTAVDLHLELPSARP